MNKFCRSEVEISCEDEFIHILKENNIQDFEYIGQKRSNNQTFSVYDVGFNNQAQYELIVRNSDTCQLLNFYD